MEYIKTIINTSYRVFKVKSTSILFSISEHTCAMTLMFTLQHEFELSTHPSIPSNGHVGGLCLFLLYYNSPKLLSRFSLEMPIPSQGHYGFHSFPVVD
jgi:hypothetical protein